MVKAWLVLYRGQLVIRKVTQTGAKAEAFRLIKERGYNPDLLEVRQMEDKSNA